MKFEESTYKTLTDYIFLLLSRGYGEKTLNAGMPEGHLVKSLINHVDMVAMNPKIYPGVQDIYVETKGIFRRKTDLGHLPADLDTVNFKFQFIYGLPKGSLMIRYLQASMRDKKEIISLRGGIDLPQSNEIHEGLLKSELRQLNSSPLDFPSINFNKIRESLNKIKDSMVRHGYNGLGSHTEDRNSPWFQQMDELVIRAHQKSSLWQNQPFTVDVRKMLNLDDMLEFKFNFSLNAMDRVVNLFSIVAQHKNQKTLMFPANNQDFPTPNEFLKKLTDPNKYLKAQQIHNHPVNNHKKLHR